MSMRYRKKPIVVEAVQYTGYNEDELIKFTHGYFRLSKFPAEVYDKIHETWIFVAIGQFIIRGSKGEFYPHDEELFYQNYETEDGKPILG